MRSAKGWQSRGARTLAACGARSPGPATLPRKAPRMARAVAACGALAWLVCAGCTYLAYIPLLVFAPFIPLVQLAIKVAARYGPLLLMLAEADPAMTPGAPCMIAAEPRALTSGTVLPALETVLQREAAQNDALRAVTLVDIARLTPEWIEAEVQRAQRRGWRVRAIFVDSRAAAAGAGVTPATMAALAARGVQVRAGGAVAARVAGTPAQVVSMLPPVPEHISAGEAALLGALAGPPGAAAQES